MMSYECGSPKPNSGISGWKPLVASALSTSSHRFIHPCAFGSPSTPSMCPTHHCTRSICSSGIGGPAAMPFEPMRKASMSEATGRTPKRSSSWAISSPRGFIGFVTSYCQIAASGLVSSRVACRFRSMYAGSEGRPVSQPGGCEMSCRMTYTCQSSRSGMSNPNMPTLVCMSRSAIVGGSHCNIMSCSACSRCSSLSSSMSSFHWLSCCCAVAYRSFISARTGASAARATSRASRDW
mmetsp:Transcript_1449/g.4099  ORF Transcript_1449/g.4099 Transcript_1449/m.4099 type:complete len:237 (-) Transcript_1449:603-1313(-)